MSWGEVKSALNDDISVPLNRQRGLVFIETNGSFVAPLTADYLITACAAGNKGTDAPNSNKATGGVAGGSAGEVFSGTMKLQEGEVVSITVGEGNTVFGDYFTLIKGGGLRGTPGVGATVAAQRVVAPTNKYIATVEPQPPSGEGRVSTQSISGIYSKIPACGIGVPGVGSVGKTAYGGGTNIGNPPDARGYGCGGNAAAPDGTALHTGGNGSPGIVIIEW